MAVEKMKFLNLIIIGFLICIVGCAPITTTNLIKTYPPLDNKAEVRVFGLYEQVPKDSEVLGVVEVGKSDNRVKCTYEFVIDTAKSEARKAGGNAIKIIEHIPRSIYEISRHQIKAKILKVQDINAPAIMSKTDSLMLNADYALLHVYWLDKPNIMNNYVNRPFDLHLGDSVILRVSCSSRKTLVIKKDGYNSLWVKTPRKEEIPINIKFGKEYYIRFCYTMNIAFGTPSFDKSGIGPKLEIVDAVRGQGEFESVPLVQSEIIDRLILNDGTVINCRIWNEDSDYIYYSALKDKKEIKSQIKKTDIKTIYDRGVR